MKKNHNSKNYDPANQCVTCGCAMLEGDHVCIGCRTGRAIYPHGLNVRVTDAQMAAVEAKNASKMGHHGTLAMQYALRIGELTIPVMEREAEVGQHYLEREVYGNID